MWIICEGLDRSGKSTVAGYYKNQGYEIVHMSAPNKKYFEPGYSGPSYLEEVVEMYNIYAGKDTFFDRSPWGELIWPQIFNRMPLLNDDDFEYLQQLEYNQNAEKYLLYDQDTEAHWKRCLANNEPINRVQFMTASRLYENLANDRGFEKKQLSDFSQMVQQDEQTTQRKNKEKAVQKTKESPDRDAGDVGGSGTDDGSQSYDKPYSTQNNLTMEQRLDRANAIRSLLDGQILKKKGPIYENIEQDIRRFLEKEIRRVFSGSNEEHFTQDEIIILKQTAQRIKAKME